MVENVEFQTLQASGHTPTSNSVPVFTSAQYAELMKLLGNASVQTWAELVVNMACNMHSSSTAQPFADWIIDSGANEHMVGDLQRYVILSLR